MISGKENECYSIFQYSYTLLVAARHVRNFILGSVLQLCLLRKIVEQKRTIKFFLGPNKDLDEAKGRITRTKPLPTIREAFAAVRREESRKKLMMPDNHLLFKRSTNCEVEIYTNAT